eukprot:8381625-Karenia_brevis.AAC.1
MFFVWGYVLSHQSTNNAQAGGPKQPGHPPTGWQFPPIRPARLIRRVMDDHDDCESQASGGGWRSNSASSR